MRNKIKIEIICALIRAQCVINDKRQLSGGILVILRLISPFTMLGRLEKQKMKVK